MNVLLLSSLKVPISRHGGSVSTLAMNGKLSSKVGVGWVQDARIALVLDLVTLFLRQGEPLLMFIPNWRQNGIPPRMSALQHTTSPVPASRFGGSASNLAMSGQQ